MAQPKDIFETMAGENDTASIQEPVKVFETVATPDASTKIFRMFMALPEKAIKPNKRNDKYPFDDLVAPVDGQCDGFFVPATVKMPNPAKSLVSAVNSATRKYAAIVGVSETLTKTGKQRNIYVNTREFKVVPHCVDGVDGAFVARVE